VTREKGKNTAASIRARLLTRDAVQEADLILTMSRSHRVRVADLGGGTKSHLLGEYAGRSGTSAEIRDPFSGDIEGYRQTFIELDELLDLVVERLQRERSGDRR